MKKQFYSGCLNCSTFYTKFYLISWVIFNLVFAFDSVGNIRYVKPKSTGTGDGLSWTNATGNLQLAIKNSLPNDEVWVMKGIYKPTSCPGNCITPVSQRDFAFLLKNQVKLYGSFDGTESTLEERKALNSQSDYSILSGDIGIIGDSTDNAYHVVISVNSDAKTLLNGFKIVNGNANGSGGRIMIDNIWVPSSSGGGLLIVAGSPLISDCLIFSNNAYSGGGIFVSEKSTAKLLNCTINKNNSESNGGGIEINYSYPILTSCIISSNLANKGFAGGVLNINGTSSEFSYCKINNNSSLTMGGGMANVSSTTLISNTTFLNNKTSSYGGALNNYSSTADIRNSVFYGNSAFRGGAIDNLILNLTAINCTFVNNIAEEKGAGLSNISGNVNLKNCIAWHNSIDGVNIYVSYSNIEGGFVGLSNINENPNFKDIFDLDGKDDVLGNSDDGLYLMKCSPAINSGDSIGVNFSTDITGDVRIKNGKIDMGAYESSFTNCSFQPRLYVNINAKGANTGLSWKDALIDLQDALEYKNFDEIWVASGTYKPSKDNEGNQNPPNPRNKTFNLLNGKKLYGGFAGSESNLAERTKVVLKLNESILSGDIGVANDNSDNSFNVLVSEYDSSTTIIDGFTISHGNGLNGSGMRNAFSQATIRNCTFSDNNSRFDGGAMYNYHSSLNEIYQCNFISNKAGDYGDGGGIANVYESHPKIINCSFSNNISSWDNGGGGIYNNSSSPYIFNCVFVGNTCKLDGGGVFNHNNSSPSIINCVFFANFAARGGGGVLSSGNSKPIIKNSIFWQNKAGKVFNDVESGLALLDVTYSSVGSGYQGKGNINDDPLFVNEDDPDGLDNVYGTDDDGLRLSEDSRSLNSGDSAGVYIKTDIIGNLRIQGKNIDMGPYEFHVENPVPPIKLLPIFEEKTLSIIEIFPNPVGDLLKFKYNNKEDNELEIFVTDILGAIKYQMHIANFDAETTQSIVTNFLTPGIYVLIIKPKSKDKYYGKKFLK